MKRLLLKVVSTAAALLLASIAAADALVEGFRVLPSTARPLVWWHWMDGNISKDGIRKDLDWMQRVGIGGVQTFDVALPAPQIVEHRLRYMSPEWQDAFRDAIEQADSRGLEFAIATSPGWSETGGPWVEAQDAMKKLVWSERAVLGGRLFKGVLEKPASVTGPFQDIPRWMPSWMGSTDRPMPTHYGDVAVIAYPLIATRLPSAPRYQTIDGLELDAATLTDGRYGAGVNVPRSKGTSPTFVTVTFAHAEPIRAATLAIANRGWPNGQADVKPQLQASDDGLSFRPVADFELVNGVATTASFPLVSARYFRWALRPSPPPSPEYFATAPGAIVTPWEYAASQDHYEVTEMHLDSRARVDQFERKAGFALANDYYALTTSASDEGAIEPRSIIDLTSKMSAEGQLEWLAPPGRWVVLRLGYSLTGAVNKPASPEATGLEVDKLDGAAVARYMNRYLRTYAAVVGQPLAASRGVRALVTDSIEAGPSNWTAEMIKQFKRLRGYDPLPWLPALTGVLIGSRRETDAFLYDFRRTIGDLLASEHYAQIAASAHRHGLTVYGEALEHGRNAIGDDIALRRYADIPMGALWTYPASGHPVYGLLGDLKGAASVAHVYGRRLVAAEMLTSANAPWAHAPADLKPIVDLAFAYGVNRPAIHTSVHQPSDEKLPGLSLWFYGQYFNRHETWAEMARPWMDYIARSSFLLQQGQYVADVAYFYGEEAPLAALWLSGPPSDVPSRYGYDFVNADIVLNELSVDHGCLITRSGMRYRVLYLGGNSGRMTVPLLRKLKSLLAAGATIVGERPLGTPSLADNPAELDKLADELWQAGQFRKSGPGRLIAQGAPEAVLASLGRIPDFEIRDDDAAGILSMHRHANDADIYFLTNRESRARSFRGRFRVHAQYAELWRADSGSIEPVAFKQDGRAAVLSLSMAPQEALFVVFRARPSSKAKSGGLSRPRTIAKIETPWTVTFQPGRGAPRSIQLDKLISLTHSDIAGVKYFSGVSRYSTQIECPKGFDPKTLVLDLGAVGDLAEVFVNGRKVATLWKAPFIVPVGEALRRGTNLLQVDVANLWVNRLIGDAQPGAKPVAFTTVPTYSAEAPLRPSGLMGPVTLLSHDP